MKEPLIVRMAREIIDVYEENLFLHQENIRLQRENAEWFGRCMNSLEQGNANMENAIFALITPSDVLDKAKACVKE